MEHSSRSPLSRYHMECPEDILRLIFEATVNNHHHPSANLKTATRVAAVCGTWRVVALKTPRIWNSIILDMGTDEKDMKEYWARTVERVGSVPTTIHVYNMSSDRPMDLSKMIFEASLAIDSVQLHFKRPSDVGRLAEIWGNTPIAVRSLTISPQKQTKKQPTSLPNRWGPMIPAWGPDGIDCGRFLEAFHFPHSLSINGWNNPVAFIAPATRGDIRCVQLHLSKIRRLDLGHLFSEFPSMEYLFLSECILGKPSANTTAPMLRSLHIKLCDNAWGLMADTFPRLRSFSYHGPSRPVLSFLKRHQKITELSLAGTALQGFEFEELIGCANQVRSLTLTVHWALELIDGHVFPSLTSLTIVDDGTLRPTEFDSLLRGRFLRISHPDNKGKSTLQVIDRLFPDMEQFHHTCMNGSLLNDHCFVEPTKEVQRDPDGRPVLIRFSWPAHPLGSPDGRLLFGAFHTVDDV